MKFKILNFLFTGEIAKDNQYIKKIAIILLIGLILRLVLMPISMHNDFLSEHIRAEFIIFGGHPFAVTSQFLSHYIDAAFLFIFSPFIADHAKVFNLPAFVGSASTVENESFLNFIDSPSSYRTLFLLKIPYLLCDFLCFFMLIRLLSTKKSSFWLACFWMFNPVSIYAIYVYGRFEIYWAMFLIASLLLSKKEKPYLSSLMFGLAIASRSYLLMMIPLFSLLISKKLITKIASFFIAIAPILLYNLLSKLLGYSPFFYKSVPTSNIIESLAEGGFIGLGLIPRIDFGSYQLYLLILAFILIYTWILCKKEHGFKSIITGCSLIILSYFLLAPFSTHWFFWTIPWLALILTEIPKIRWTAWAICSAWFLHSALFSDWSVFTLYLFSPINPQYFMTRPNLSQIILALTANIGTGAKSIISPEILLGIVRSFLTVFILWVMVNIIRNKASKHLSE